MRPLNAIAGTHRTKACLLAAAVTLLPLAIYAVAVYAVDGFDLPGSDYANFNASSAFVCRNTCGGDS
jgi:hypothetical protein